MAKLTKTSLVQPSVSNKAISLESDTSLVQENQQLRLELKEARQELEHVRMLLNKLDIANIVRPLSDEEEIASIQLQKLKTQSRERQLTLEELKMFDLLVKNLRLAQGEVTEIKGNKSMTGRPKTDLLKIAATKK